MTRRRLAVATAALASLAACSSTPAARPSVPTPAATSAPASTAGPASVDDVTVAAFPDSIWTTPLPADVALDPHSGAMAADLAQQLSSLLTSKGFHATVNTVEYAPPVYRVDAGASTVAVVGKACQTSQSAGAMATWTTEMGPVPVPDGAQPSAGRDQEMVVWQPSTDTLWELWHAVKQADGSWTACWGGRLAGVSTSGGVFPKPYGTTASGISLLAGLITPSEMASGHIDHALSVGLPVTARTQVLPAVRTDGKGLDGTTLAEGSRFRLPADYPVTGSASRKALLTALKTYGAVVRDTSGAFSVYAENTLASTGTDAWTSLLQPGRSSVLDGVDWSQIQVVAPAAAVTPAG